MLLFDRIVTCRWQKVLYVQPCSCQLAFVPLSRYLSVLKAPRAPQTLAAMLSSLEFLQSLMLAMLAADVGGDVQPSAAELLEEENSGSVALVQDTDGTNAAQPSAEASHEDAAANNIAAVSDEAEGDSSAAQQVDTGGGTEPVSSSEEVMSEADERQADTTASSEEAALEGAARSNGSAIKRTPSSITFKFK